MLGDKVAESTGRVTGRRVMPGGKVEVSFEAAGKVLGIDEREIGTYASTMRPDGTLYGEGQGVIMGKGGESAMWVGSGVGTIKADGSVSYRGAVYYQGNSPAWARLNAVALVFEHEVDPQGNSRSQLWEWK